MRCLKKDAKKGFTIVELMVVSALIAILATLTIVNVDKYRMQARDRVRVSDINKIRLAIEQYKLACGEYPARLEPDIHNGCVYGQKLKDFLPYVPINPDYTNDSAKSFVDANQDSQIEPNQNTYLYSALAASSNGKCYDYHIGAFFEGGEQRFLSIDHDAGKMVSPYNHKCHGAKEDFDGGDGAYGPYDLRSKSSYGN